MNPYLTQKSLKGYAGRATAAAICTFIAAVTVSTTADFVMQKEWDTVGASVLILALLLFSVYRNMRHIMFCREAQQIARHLICRTEECVSIEQLNADIAKPRLAKKISDLIDRGYLQNVRVDAQKRSIVLTAPNQRVVNDEIVAMECPNCGAQNQVTRGRVGRCFYCEQPLILPTSEKKEG